MGESEFPHLNNAPIVEALVGIDYEPLAPAVLEAFSGINARLKEQYPHQENVSSIEVTQPFDGTVALPTQSKQQSIGFRLRHATEPFAFSIRIDGFHFSRLVPYDDWDHLMDAAEATWVAYAGVIAPLVPRTLTVRFINKLPLPVGEDIDQYLRIYPNCPRDFPGNEIWHYQLRMQMNLGGEGYLQLQQTVVPHDEPGKIGIVLDADLRFPAGGLDRNKLWENLRSKRNLKNQVFFRSITPKMVEVLKAR